MNDFQKRCLLLDIEKTFEILLMGDAEKHLHDILTKVDSNGHTPLQLIAENGSVEKFIFTEKQMNKVQFLPSNL